MPQGARNHTATETLLREIPLDVVIELGRIRMTAGDLANLEVKDLLPLTEMESGGLALVIRGQKIGEGELMLLNDTLALKVNSINGVVPKGV